MTDLITAPDLLTAFAMMGGISLTLGLICGLAPVPRGQWLVLCLTAALCGGFAFLWYSAGRLYWAGWIGASAVIVWSNFTPLLFAVAAGLAFRLPKTPLWRRCLSGTLLGLVTVPALFWPLIGPALRPPPEGNNLVRQGVVMQSSWATCSPAAAATLLSQTGIPTSERQMIGPCLTDEAGTPTLGLYRGLKLAAEAAGRDVQVVSGGSDSIEQLLAADQWPVLLLVRLPLTGVDDPRYEQEWGWIKGMGHSVVANGITADGRIEILDPSIGRETWRTEDLQVLWHGDALRLTK